MSLDSSATVIVVAIPAVPEQEPDDPLTFPVTSPVKLTTKLVAVRAPEDQLNVKLDPLLGPKLPVAAVANKGKQVVSLDSSATVIAEAVVPDGLANDNTPAPSVTRACPLLP